MEPVIAWHIFKISMSLDKYQQSMENWKKEIIIDPHLNSLFDTQISAEQFLRTKILPLAHEDIVKVYMKLTSLKHAVAKSMQKEIETKHAKIQQSFVECLSSKSSYEEIDQDKIKENLKQIQKFNEKYELISDRVTEIRNINKILHFAQALQKFKVNARLLKSMMKDFDQSHSSHWQGELLNTSKISKIIKEISAITIKHDFSGIKSFQEERIFLNQTKGAIFGLVQKELTVALLKIPNIQTHKRSDLQKDIISKFCVLNNITKLKDFCIPFYKNILKEMSELLKKSLVIGQSGDERDPKAYLQVFESYFSNSLKKKLVQTGRIFIVLEQMLSKSGIKTPFNFNFFEKYWENITGFMKDLINWSMDNDSKEFAKEKLSQNLYESFSLLDNKNYLSKYITSIVWKYPILYDSLTSISNQIHLDIIKHAELHQYGFPVMKETFLRVLVPLAQLYYRHSSLFYSNWKTKVTTIRTKYSNEEGNSQNFPLSRVVELFQQSKNAKTNQSLDQTYRIIQWLTFNIKTKEIYQFHIDKILGVIGEYLHICVETFGRYNRQSHSKDDFGHFLSKFQRLLQKIKEVIKRGRVSEEGVFEWTFKGMSPKKGVLAANVGQLVELIKRFKSFESVMSECRSKML